MSDWRLVVNLPWIYIIKHVINLLLFRKVISSALCSGPLWEKLKKTRKKDMPEYTVKWRQRNFQLEQGTDCYSIGKNVRQVGNVLTINIYIFLNFWPSNRSIRVSKKSEILHWFQNGAIHLCSLLLSKVRGKNSIFKGLFSSKTIFGS
jgi:hypothetical protein